MVLSCPENSAYSVDFNLFGLVPVKTLKVSSYEDGLYMPSGQAVGIKLYTDGVLVIGLAENLPAYNAGIKVNDIITHINDTKVLNAVHFSALLNKNENAPLTLTAIRDGSTFNVDVTPVYTENEYKIGAWVRDSSAGIGTLTYVEAKTQSFGALGHGICDIDTGSTLTLMQGNLTDCEIVDIVKGEKGAAGRLCGVLSGGEKGVIKKNCELGIYGNLDPTAVYTAEPVPIASRFEIREGEATILATVDTGAPEEYSVYIEQINTADNSNTSMVIKITDERLIQKTGGIVQGMSGSPILQNGKLIGAVTHVFINDPTKGYGIFIENMLAEAENVK